MKILMQTQQLLSLFRPAFAIEGYGYINPWTTNLLNNLDATKNALEIGFVLPIWDKERLNDGIFQGYKYYSFWAVPELRVDFDITNSKCMDEIEILTQRLQEVLNDFRPDIVHIWGFEIPFSYAMLLACERLSIGHKVISDIQGLVFTWRNAVNSLSNSVELNEMLVSDLRHESNKYFNFGELDKKYIKQAKIFIGRTEYDRAYIKLLNPKAHYYKVNRILRDDFYATAGKWRLDNCVRHSIFLSQGHYPLKGLHFLLEALPYLVEYFPNIKLSVGGYKLKTAYGEYIEKLIEELKLQDRVNFLGRLDEKEMIAAYLTAHISVCPSIMENNANSLVEAKMLGVPVVASYVGGIPSIITHGIDGFLYQHDAPYMLAHYIKTIFEDDELALNLSKNGTKNALEMADKDQIIKNMLEIYETIFNENGS
ncbi:MAG: glycosyltransferase family 4 protein [Turicibacter sp.]|nr:glycosyltransferase family 4 protein [Turicibacter sp.]